MSSPMTNRIHVPKPPPLSWKVVCQLTHLNNAEKFPLPLILAASRDEDALIDDEDHTFEGTSDRERFSMMRRDAGRKSPTVSVPVAPASGATASHGNNKKYFTISKKGRTLADFSRRESFQQPRDGDRESTSDRQVPLPSYLVNPFATVLFEKPKAGAHDGSMSKRRKSDARRRSGVGVGGGETADTQGFFLEAVVDDEPPLATFTPSTFSREGILNVAQMRVLEKASSSREAANRRALEAVHLKEAANGGDSWALAVVGAITHDVSEKTSPRTSKTARGTPSMVSHSLPQLQLPSPRTPCTPRAMLDILHRQQLLTVNLQAAFQSQIVRPSHGLHGTPELIDWQLPPVPLKAVQPLEVQSPAQCHVLDINKVVTPPPPLMSLHHRSQRTSSPTGSDDVSHHSQLGGSIPRRESPPMKFPSPRRTKVQSERKPIHSASTPRDQSSDGRGMRVIVDEKTGIASYKPNPLRELGSEVNFH